MLTVNIWVHATLKNDYEIFKLEKKVTHPLPCSLQTGTRLLLMDPTNKGRWLANALSLCVSFPHSLWLPEKNHWSIHTQSQQTPGIHSGPCTCLCSTRNWITFSEVYLIAIAITYRVSCFKWAFTLCLIDFRPSILWRVSFPFLQITLWPFNVIIIVIYRLWVCVVFGLTSFLQLLSNINYFRILCWKHF